MMDDIHAAAEILGVSGKLSAARIRAAYHRAMQKWHPDLHQGKDTLKLAEWNAQRINTARDRLLAASEVGEVAGTPAGARSARRAPQNSRPTPRPARTARFDDREATAHRLRSSVFEAAAYNETLRVLYLRFLSGAVYRYLDVPRNVLSKLLRAKSKSSFAKRNIFPRYQFERV